MIHGDSGRAARSSAGRGAVRSAVCSRSAAPTTFAARLAHASARLARVGIGASAGVCIAACSSSSSPSQSIYTEAGTAGVTTAMTAPLANDAGAAVQPFTVGGPADPGPGRIYVTISGESNALTGYPFPPSDWTNDTYLFDGWEFVIKEYIVNVDKITLWSNPDLSPTDPSQHGPQVAHLAGPFVVDLHKGGTIIGQGGAPEEATAIGTLVDQNDNRGAEFDPATTYGFGFSTVAAAYAGYNVNLTSDEASDFDWMVQNGYSVLYVGSATWLGSQSQYGCTQTMTGAAPDGGGAYDFTKLPPTMTFRLGFSTPTNYVNCQNQTMQGMPVGGEDYPRGIQVSASQSVVAQVTVHMDHPFWESFAENSPVHWDQIAAQYVGATGVPEAHTEDLKGVPFYAFTDKLGAPLPWRNCSGPNYTPPGNGQMQFNPLSVPVDPSGTDPSKALRDYYDYIRYSQSTQGHLNSQGLCFISRQYPAPPGGS
jgi:hypothetical protein